MVFVEAGGRAEGVGWVLEGEGGWRGGVEEEGGEVGEVGGWRDAIDLTLDIERAVERYPPVGRTCLG